MSEEKEENKLEEKVDHTDCHAGCHHEKKMPFSKQSIKIGRNDPCFCGSGKKYKRCCLQ
jgi:uncharacterized protein YecA (UPF0149 family)